MWFIIFLCFLSRIKTFFKSTFKPFLTTIANIRRRRICIAYFFFKMFTIVVTYFAKLTVSYFANTHVFFAEIFNITIKSVQTSIIGMTITTYFGALL